jgi:hypothetical protein
VQTSSNRRLLVTGALQGNVAYSGSLSEAAGGAPAQLHSTARVGNNVEAQQAVTFDYAGAQNTTIKLPG